ncbi:LPS export ABC transporter periplasmic protein LptC [Salinimonas iocasae]|uniref:Lipopolysaccharide export system protein LptC n=1 Tax=Salinimonas iocasae TaxID=2572577 RepID=A0A5B7YG35_9ALTE|nr:LPS export ABC transporter periplasmic protein LptC [Salinimonas iocasae]QCZ94498.1 LPS export ABC transporter periplasmic protein LptC [Salinimonas iocasae]
MSRLRLSIGALFVLVLLVYFPIWISEPDKSVQSQGNTALKPAYTAKNLTTTLYDGEGKLNHQVFAKRMEHYDQLDFVLFEEPEYTVYMDGGQTPWQVTANEGTLYNNNLIELEADVTVTSSQNEFLKSIKTEFIRINLEDKTLSTEQPVVVRGVEFVVDSNGLKGNLRSQEYELNNHVQTVYSPGR